MSTWGITEIVFKCDDLENTKTTGELQVSSSAGSVAPSSKVVYWAASPATRGYSYSGSGLPYGNEDQAFGRTPNKGVTIADGSGIFTVNIQRPNSYYDKDRNLVNPKLYYRECTSDVVGSIDVSDHTVSFMIRLQKTTFISINIFC